MGAWFNLGVKFYFPIAVLSPCPIAKLPSGVAIAAPIPRPIPKPPKKNVEIKFYQPPYRDNG